MRRIVHLALLLLTTTATLSAQQLQRDIEYGHAGGERLLLDVHHRDADKTVPLQQSLNFQDHARPLQLPCELIVIPGAPHALVTWQQCAPDHNDRMPAWLRATLALPISAP